MGVHILYHVKKKSFSIVSWPQKTCQPFWQSNLQILCLTVKLWPLRQDKLSVEKSSAANKLKSKCWFNISRTIFLLRTPSYYVFIHFIFLVLIRVSCWKQKSSFGCWIASQPFEELWLPACRKENEFDVKIVFHLPYFLAFENFP